MRSMWMTAMLGLVALAAATRHASLHVRDFDPNNLADDATWEKFKCKGSKLVQAMKSSDAEAGQLMDRPSAESEFRGDMKKHLDTWAYTDGFAMQMACNFKNYWNVGSVCSALGINPSPKMMGGDSTCYTLQHWDPSKKDEGGNSIPKSKQTYLVGDKEYRVTGAEVELAVNPVGGVIFEQYVTSPKTAAGNIWDKQPSLDELPKLRALSDLMWAIWTRENPDTKNIRYFWVQGAANTNTKRLIARALREAGKTLEKWPGTSFTMDEDAGRAILASENAACFAYFLSQRKAELGMLTIEKVTVFRNDGTSNVDLDLVFHVTTVSNAQAASDDVQGKAILPNGARIGGNDVSKHMMRTHIIREQAASTA